jgi:hypothetical protein
MLPREVTSQCLATVELPADTSAPPHLYQALVKVVPIIAAGWLGLLLESTRFMFVQGPVSTKPLGYGCSL